MLHGARPEEIKFLLEKSMQDTCKVYLVGRYNEHVQFYGLWYMTRALMYRARMWHSVALRHAVPGGLLHIAHYFPDGFTPRVVCHSSGEDAIPFGVVQ